MSGALISYLHPPIPVRDRDYCATREDFEPGEPIGYGATPSAALADLREQEEIAGIDDEPIPWHPCPECGGTGQSEGAECVNCSGAGAFDAHGEPLNPRP